MLGCEIINTESGDQYCFLRAFITKGDETIKIELLQNIHTVNPVEEINGVRIFSKTDIGLLKLMSAANRKANKDIYDLDYLTDEIPLKELLDQLSDKLFLYNREEYKCLFDLDDQLSPTEDISLLLEFDKTDYSSLPMRPSHSSDRIDIVPSNKSWRVAKASWRRKVYHLMQEKGLKLPGAKPIN